MSKRKLNRRQTWRVEKIQQQREARAIKRDDTIDETQLVNDLGPEQQGLVLAHYGTQVEIEPISGPAANIPGDESNATENNFTANQTGSPRHCHFRNHLGSLVTGDRVIWRDGEPTGVVVAIQERGSQLCRPDPYGDLKTIAANIDRILIVIAPLPLPHTQTIDRYLVAAEMLGIKPAIVINKMDLVDSDNKKTIHTIMKLYRQLGYEVLTTSIRRDRGLNDLIDFLARHTSVFVGQSGVGKSSLINRLIPNLNLQVGALSEASQTGTHTTTTARLFHFPGGGHLIDSPGIREFGLWHLSAAEIMEGFIEFRPFIGHCKFRNCRHRQEPGCAIMNAFEVGKISEYRMNSYRELSRG